MVSAIENRYHCTLPIGFVDELFEYTAADSCISAICYMQEGKPAVEISIPALKVSFDNKKKFRPEFFRGAFECSLIIGIMHELDHIFLGQIGLTESLSELIKSECVVWARTCENTIRVLLQDYGQKLGFSDVQIYSAWVGCNRDATSQQWRHCIENMYGRPEGY